MGSLALSSHMQLLWLAKHSICGQNLIPFRQDCHLHFSTHCIRLILCCTVIWLLWTADGMSAKVKKHVSVVAADICTRNALNYHSHFSLMTPSHRFFGNF
jgi:hypothetical protein